eukprot:TRINITY_DN4959_c0_g1_i1.p1 TRINITY_DN4959_c0_g1~~TRINITY_DN4959_c0_g1_i1.p1  ORF type:complete len:695 (+),score=110.43 TRINITY_DN4959_c0_g1_i1:213-2087(+)
MHGVHQAGLIISVVTMSVSLFALCATGWSPFNVVGSAAALHLFVIVALDWYAAALAQPRFWSLSVLLLDMCLMVNASPAFLVFILMGTMTWVLTERAEAVFLFGLYDAGVYDESVAGTAGGTIDLCDCVSPPCGERLGRSVAGISGVLLVFLGDFYFTNGFAKSMKEQLRVVAAAVNVASSVVDALSRYEIAEAEVVVDAAGDVLPPELLDSFRTLVANLKSYRPYIPASCLVTETETYDEQVEEEDAGPTAVNSVSSRVEVCSMHEGGISRLSSGVSSPRGGLKEQQREADTLPPRQRSARSSHMRSSSRLSGSLHESVMLQVVPPVGILRRTEPVGATTQHPQWKQISVLVTNVLDFLTLVPARSQGHTEIMHTIVSRFAAAVPAHKGVVDLVNADHLFASFGGARYCALHRVAAARCGMKATEPLAITGDRELLFTSAAASGLGLCGDMGSDTMKRFHVTGGVVSHLLVLERMAADWGAGLVVDNSLKKDLDTWVVRLRGAVLCAKRAEVPQKVWQPIGERQGGDAGEWMYEMPQGGHIWEPYNQALSLWLDGQNSRACAAARALMALRNGPEHSEAAQALVRQLEERRTFVYQGSTVASIRPDADASLCDSMLSHEVKPT